MFYHCTIGFQGFAQMVILRVHPDVSIFSVGIMLVGLEKGCAIGVCF